MMEREKGSFNPFADWGEFKIVLVLFILAYSAYLLVF